MRPTGPSSPTSRPSYRSCAARIVRRELKPSFLAASCCSVLVVNGAPGFFRRLRFSTLETTNGICRTASTTACASSAEWSCGLWPSTLASAASKVWPSLASSASMLQYSCGVKARISRSRSTMSRRATVCTRPADRPVLMLRQRIGLAL